MSFVKLILFVFAAGSSRLDVLKEWKTKLGVCAKDHLKSEMLCLMLSVIDRFLLFSKEASAV